MLQLWEAIVWLQTLHPGAEKRQLDRTRNTPRSRSSGSWSDGVATRLGLLRTVRQLRVFSGALGFGCWRFQIRVQGTFVAGLVFMGGSGLVA